MIMPHKLSRKRSKSEEQTSEIRENLLPKTKKKKEYKIMMSKESSNMKEVYLLIIIHGIGSTPEHREY